MHKLSAEEKAISQGHKNCVTLMLHFCCVVETEHPEHKKQKTAASGCLEGQRVSGAAGNIQKYAGGLGTQCFSSRITSSCAGFTCAMGKASVETVSFAILTTFLSIQRMAAQQKKGLPHTWCSSPRRDRFY